MSFSKDRAIIAQNSASVASAITAAIITANPEHATSTESALALFDRVRTHVFNGSIGLAGAEAVVVGTEGAAPARSGGGGPRRAPQGSGGDFVLPFGKHKGLTIAAVAELPAGTDGRDGASYLTWLRDNSNKADIVEHVRSFLEG